MSGRPELRQVATLFGSSSSSSSSSAPPSGSGRFLATPGPVKSGDTNLNKKKLYSFLYSIGAQTFDFQKLNAFQDVLRELGDTESGDKTLSRDKTTVLDEFISSVLSRPEGGIPASLREIIRAYQEAKNKNNISNFSVVGLEPPASENFYSDSLKALLDDFELLFINNIIKPGKTKKATVQKKYEKLTYDEKLKDVAFGVKGNSLGAGAKQVENRLIGLLWEVDLEDRINHRNIILPSLRKLGISQKDYFSLQIRPIETLPGVVERGKKKAKKEAKEQRPELPESEKRREEVLSTVFVPVADAPAQQPASAQFFDPWEEMTEEERAEDRRRMDQLVMEAREIEDARLAGRGRRENLPGKIFSAGIKMNLQDPALRILVNRARNPFVPGTRPEAMKLKPHFSLITAEYKDALNRDQKSYCVFLWKDYCRVVFSGIRGTMPDLFINSRPCSVDQFKECLLKNRRILMQRAESPDDVENLKSAERFAKIVERKVPSFELALQGLEGAMKEAARQGDTARMADFAKQKKRLIDNRKFFEDENEKLQKESDFIPFDEKFTSSSGKVYAYQGLLKQDDFARVLQGNQCDSVLVRDAVNSLINIRATELVNKVIYYSRNDLSEGEYADEDKQLFDAIRGISKPRRYCSPTEIGPDWIIRRQEAPAAGLQDIAISTQAPAAYISSNPNAVMGRSGDQTVVPLQFVSGRSRQAEGTEFIPIVDRGVKDEADAFINLDKEFGQAGEDEDKIGKAFEDRRAAEKAANEKRMAAYGSSSSSGSN